MVILGLIGLLVSFKKALLNKWLSVYKSKQEKCWEKNNNDAPDPGRRADPWVECELPCCEGHPWVQLFQTHIRDQ